jgi:hypothetical protein
LIKRLADALGERIRSNFDAFRQPLERPVALAAIFQL